jgi:hypothetical protein
MPVNAAKKQANFKRQAKTRNTVNEVIMTEVNSYDNCVIRRPIDLANLSSVEYIDFACD